jgi:cytidylate kinase
VPALAPVVTLSASYGAGGSVVGPRVAELLGVPFLDRAIPTAVSRALAVPLEEALARDERIEHGLGFVLASLARLPAFDIAPPATPLLDDRAFKDECERVIRGQARDGAVVLGRAAAVVLAGRPGALHVRLDGPAEARVAQAARILGLDEARAREERRDADRARDAYVRHFYRADASDPALYQLVLDSTALELDTCAELIAVAARGRLRTAR